MFLLSILAFLFLCLIIKILKIVGVFFFYLSCICIKNIISLYLIFIDRWQLLDMGTLSPSPCTKISSLSFFSPKKTNHVSAVHLSGAVAAGLGGRVGHVPMTGERLPLRVQGRGDREDARGGSWSRERVTFCSGKRWRVSKSGSFLKTEENDGGA